MSPSEAIKIMERLKAMYPRQPISLETAAVYCDALARLDYAATLAAVDLHFETEKFFPSMSEIRAAGLTLTGDGDLVTDAWQEVQRAISSVGRYRSPTWSSPLIAAAVDTIGWENICNSEDLDGRTWPHFRDSFAIEKKRAEHAAVADGIRARHRLGDGAHLQLPSAPSALPDPTKRASRCTTSTSIDHPQGGQLGVTCEGGAGHQGHHHATVRGERVAWDANGWRVK